ncbi:MAG: TRAP transporter small permease subunit [Desulfatiglandales bacterium]
MEKLLRSIDAINRFIGRIASISAFFLVLVVFFDVLMRYLFKKSWVFTQELEWHIFAFLFLMAAGYTLLQDAHVRVDILYQNLSPRVKAWINLIGTLFFLIPGCLMVIDTSFKFTLNSYLIKEGSPDPGGIPFRFLIKGCIPVGFSLLLLQGIAMGIRSLLVLLGKGGSEVEGR